MNNEELFKALSEVGDDLIVMAEQKRFVSPWRKWAQTAAVLAVVVCLGVLVLPYFPMGCGSTQETAPMLTTDSAIEETEECAIEESAAYEELDECLHETPCECVDETKVPELSVSDGIDESAQQKTEENRKAKPMTKIICRGTFYYLQEDVKIEGVPLLGEELGVVTDSDDDALVGCKVYAVPYSTWFGNYAVNGEPVTQQIYVQTPSGYCYGTTYNEKVVSRYTIDDVRTAVNKENYDWLADTFVQPIEAVGDVDFMDSSELTSEELNTMFFASAAMNTGVTVTSRWLDDATGDYVVPIDDVQWRLYRFLDGGYDYKPQTTELYDEARHAIVCPSTSVKYVDVNITVHAAKIIEENKLFLLISLPDQKGVTKEYIIRFDKGSWRYETINELDPDGVTE